jgi:hypothetical protein
VHRVSEAAAVSFVCEAGVLHGEPHAACSKIDVERRWTDKDTRIEDVQWVEYALNGLEKADSGRRVHAWQQLAMCAAVSVLSGHRTAVLCHEISRFEKEALKAMDTVVPA